MKLLFISSVLLAAGVAIACTDSAITPSLAPDGATTKPAPATNRTPVLVELFTSEGCSSCPPADRNLAFLKKEQPVVNADIITLAFHVDYWDRLGWKDRFSSAVFTKRQNIYAGKMGSEVYTPQMVVDGQTEFVGSDGGRAAEAIAKAAAEEKVAIDIASLKDGIQIGLKDLPTHAEATVFAAIAEDGISSRVEAGENRGKNLEHVSVVRELMPIGKISPDQSNFQMLFDSQQPADSKLENLSLVVFVQENVSHKVLGVGKSKFKVTATPE